MEDRIANAHPTPELRTRTGRALVECGLWLRLGFIGAFGMAAGLFQLFAGDAKPLPALALAFGGGSLAAISWRRSRTVLDIVDATAVVTSGAALPASAITGGSASGLDCMRGERRTTTDAALRLVAAQPEPSS